MRHRLVIGFILPLLSCSPQSIDYSGQDAASLTGEAGLDATRSDLAQRDRRAPPRDAGVDLDRSLARPDVAARDAHISVPDIGGHDAGSATSDAGLCSQPRKRRGGTSLWVVNGTRQPTLVPLSNAQKLAAVGLSTPWDGSFCSGTLVAPQVVLTAEHCNPDAPGLASVSVDFSLDGMTVLYQAGVSAFYRDTTIDVGVYVLAGDPSAHVNVTPVPILPGPLDASWIGTRVEAAGWGDTTAGGTTNGRFFVAEPIYNVNATEVVINGEGLHGVCRGDSGGPLFANLAGEVRAIGSLSWGDTSCTGLDHYIRADVTRNFIERYAGATPPLGGGGGCGSVSAQGYCDAGGSRAVYCAGDQIQQDDCTQGQSCGYSASAQGYRCVSSTSDPCLGIDYLGTCNGDTATWCAGGELRSFDCGACGLSCGWIDDQVGYDCGGGGSSTDPCAGAANCGGIDYLGSCQGQDLYWCQQDNSSVCQLYTINCPSYNKSCVWIDAQMGYACQ